LKHVGVVTAFVTYAGCKESDPETQGWH
jgi:hypothetical protein